MHYIIVAGASGTFENLNPCSAVFPYDWNRVEVYKTQPTLPVDQFPHVYADPQQDRYIVFFNHPLAVKSYFANLLRVIEACPAAKRKRYIESHFHHVFVFPGQQSSVEFQLEFEKLVRSFADLGNDDINVSASTNSQLWRIDPQGQAQMGIRQALRNFWQEMLVTQYSDAERMAADSTDPFIALIKLNQENPNYIWKGVAYTNSASQFDYAGVWNDLADNLEDLLDDLDWEAYETTPKYFEVDVLKQLVENPPHLQLTTVPCYTNKLDLASVQNLAAQIHAQTAQIQTLRQSELPTPFTQAQSTQATPEQQQYLHNSGVWKQRSLRHLMLGDFKILSELCAPTGGASTLQSKYDALSNLEQDYIFLISNSNTLNRIQDFLEIDDYVQTVVTDQFNTHKVQITRATGRVEYMDYATPSCHQVNLAPMHQMSAQRGMLQLREPSQPSTPDSQSPSSQGKLLNTGTLPPQTMAYIYEFTPNPQVTLPQGKKLPVFVSLNMQDKQSFTEFLSKLDELRTLHIREL